MMRTKLIYIIIGLSLLVSLVSCERYTRREIAMYYADSIPKIEYFYKYFGNKEYIAKEVRYYPNGTTMTEGTRNEKGERHGTWTSYHNNGKKWLSEEYVNDVRDGKIVEWYLSGKKMYEGYYSEGLASGKWTTYDENGKKISSKEY